MTPTTSQDTRQRLIEAAIFTFAEKGFEGAGIREIARRAKANSALVQYYFESKEGLYLAAMEYFFTQCPTTVPTLPPPPAPDAPHAQVEAARSLRRYIRAFLDDLFLKHEVIGHTKEMNTAAHLFWIREIHEREPVPERMALMRQYLRPYSDYMRACLRALCPIWIRRPCSWQAPVSSPRSSISIGTAPSSRCCAESLTALRISNP